MSANVKARLLKRIEEIERQNKALRDELNKLKSSGDLKKREGSPAPAKKPEEVTPIMTNNKVDEAATVIKYTHQQGGFRI